MGTVSQIILLLALFAPASNAAAAPMGENPILAPLKCICDGGVLPANVPAAVQEFAERQETGQAWAGLAALLGLGGDALRSFQTAKQSPHRESLSVAKWLKFFKKAQFRLPAPRPGTTTLSRNRLAEGVSRLFAALGIVFMVLLAAAWRS